MTLSHDDVTDSVHGPDSVGTDSPHPSNSLSSQQVHTLLELYVRAHCHLEELGDPLISHPRLDKSEPIRTLLAFGPES